MSATFQGDIGGEICFFFFLSLPEIQGFFGGLYIQVCIYKRQGYSMHSVAHGLWSELYIAGADLNQQDVTSLSRGQVAIACVHQKFCEI